MFSTGGIREGQLWQLSFAAKGLDFPMAVSNCHVKEMLLYQSKFNLHSMQSGDTFLSLDLQ